MFKYISSILAQMSPDQKFKSLAILLLSISAIILTPYVLDTISTNENECKTRVDRLNDRIQNQYVLIDEFQVEIDNLNSRLQKQSRECTNKIIQRDSYWTAQLIYIRTMVNQLEKNDKLVYQTDTIVVNPSEEDLTTKNKAIQNMDYLIYKHK